MRVKHALAATTAALFLTAGAFAQAQQTSPSASEPAKPGVQSQPTSPPSTSGSSMDKPSTSGSSMDNSVAALPPGSLHEIKSDTAMAKSLNVNAKDLADMSVYGTDGKKIGGVNKVLADNSNDIKAITLDVGGFLGMGAKEVVLPIDKLQKGTEKDRLQTSLTKDEIEKLSKWQDEGSSSSPRGSSGPSRTAPGTSR
jgi:hypothetical protein